MISLEDGVGSSFSKWFAINGDSELESYSGDV